VRHAGHLLITSIGRISLSDTPVLPAARYNILKAPGAVEGARMLDLRSWLIPTVLVAGTVGLAIGACGTAQDIRRYPASKIVVEVAVADIGAVPPERPVLKFEVRDLRASKPNYIDIERQAKVVEEWEVVFHPTELELVKAIMTAKLAEDAAVLDKSAGVAPVSCEISKFSIAGVWALARSNSIRVASVEIALRLRIGDRQRVWTGFARRSPDYTAAGPPESPESVMKSMITAATVDALKAIALKSGPEIRALLATP
jgi:hypothetical protein